MPVNLDKPHQWKNDIAQSVDMYNDWFMKFAPDAFRSTRIETTKHVEAALRPPVTSRIFSRPPSESIRRSSRPSACLLARAIAGDKTLIRCVWQVLNQITPEKPLGEGRVYGGGLHKLEPKELANVPVPAIAELLPAHERPAKQADLLEALAL